MSSSTDQKTAENADNQGKDGKRWTQLHKLWEDDLLTGKCFILESDPQGHIFLGRFYILEILYYINLQRCWWADSSQWFLLIFSRKMSNCCFYLVTTHWLVRLWRQQIPANGMQVHDWGWSYSSGQHDVRLNNEVRNEIIPVHQARLQGNKWMNGWVRQQ